jgi:phenylpropionate dioxygenase-like ring-hydroxylating dioxygenase large terminal subunit
MKVELCGHHLAVYRGEDGRVRALDAYCPHMGTHLGIGKVVGETLRCFFHQWRYDGGGRCVEIPCQADIPERARVQAYAVEEKYGFIWIYPDTVAPRPVPFFDELEGQTLICTSDEPIETDCHHHVSMINGIDAQHLATVHGIRMGMDLTVEEDPQGRQVDYVLRGVVPRETLLGALVHRAIGGHYAYAMRYVDACVGLLTTVKDVRLFGSGPKLPSLHMIFARCNARRAGSPARPWSSRR